jgi:mono/diheme cytochrome c family protein
MSEKELKVFLASIGILAVILLTACPQATKKNQVADYETGSLVYERRCAYCHGSRGEMVAGPRSLQESSMTLDEIHEIVIQGEGTMPGFGEELTNEELEAVSYYVLDFQD